jgi:hypothetical protein
MGSHGRNQEPAGTETARTGRQRREERSAPARSGMGPREQAILGLQHTAGNAATAALLAESAAAGQPAEPPASPTAGHEPLQVAEAELGAAVGERAPVPAADGSRAIAMTVQRDQWIQGRPVDYNRKNRPTKGADVRAALRTQLPGLLAALSNAQLDRWQRVVDYYAITRHIDKELQQLRGSYAARYPGLKVEGEGQWTGFGAYNDEVRKIQRGRPQHPPGGDKLTVDPELLLSADVQEQPEWDLKAETAFRRWAVDQLRKDPPVFDMYPDHDDEIITRRTSLGTWTTKGVITLADLRHRFAKEYDEQVSNRDEWKKLRWAFSETLSAFYDATQVHRERSRLNAEGRGWFGVDIVRNINEALGEGDQDYPSIRQWDEPQKLINQAGPLLRERKFEMAVPVLAMAELSTAQAAQKIFAYDHRVETGAATAVKWLSRVKTAGSIAASIAAGPLGITGSALVAGGYTFLQQGAQNVSELAHGQRTDLGLAGLVKQAGTATVMGLLGGALQSRFQAAMSARLAAATGSAGGALREVAVSSAAAMTSSVYNTAAEAVLNAVINGQALPKDANALADLILDKALEAGAMDVALRGPSARVAKEYHAWRGGSTTAVIPGKAVEATGQAAKPGEAGAAKPASEIPDPRTMPEDVARRLLTEGGGWDRVLGELNAGTGLGHGLMPAERQALINRFESSRELLAREIGGMFEGTVSIVDAGAGRAIEVRFTGDAAAQHLAEARGYLETARPGWAAETGVTLHAGPKAVAGGPRSEAAAAALERATPRGREFASRLVPLYENWTGLNAQRRLELLVNAVNQWLGTLGVPEVHPAFGSRGAAEDGRFVPGHWELQINANLLKGHEQTPQQFAMACEIAIHEGYHALQTFRAARTNPVMAEKHLDKVAFKAVMDANLPGSKAEKINLSGLDWVEAARVRESMWGSGAPHNKDIYTQLDLADARLSEALAKVKQYQNRPNNDPDKRAATREMLTATKVRDAIHDDYMNLPEEVEAWKVGLETRAAVAEQLKLNELNAQIVRARKDLEGAHEAFSKIEGPLMEQLTDTSNPPSKDAQRAWQSALEHERKTRQHLESLLDKRNKLLSGKS